MFLFPFSHLVALDVQGAEGNDVGAREVQHLVPGEDPEKVVCEFQDWICDHVVDHVLVVGVSLGVGHAHGVGVKVHEGGAGLVLESVAHQLTVKAGHAHACAE